MLSEKEFKQLQIEMGTRLYLLRTLRKLKQKELGDKIGVSGNYVSEWEAGRRWIPARYMIMMAKLFDVSISHFNPLESAKVDNITFDPLDLTKIGGIS